MLSLAIEVLGAIAAVLGTVAWFRGARGNLRHAALLPVLTYAGGQAISITATGRDDFADIYPWALAVMATGGGLGLAFLIRAPARTNTDDT